MKPYVCKDVLNAYRLLESSLKQLCINVRDFEPNLSDGDGVVCAKILRILLLQSCRDVALMMLGRNVSSSSGDRRIVLSAFDLLRENSIMSPSISAEQFLGKNFVEHKIIIINKVAEYINSIKRKKNNPQSNNNNSKVSSRRNSPDDSYNPYQYSSKSYLESNYIYESTNDVDLDDEIWVSKYVNNLEDENIPLAVSQLEMSNNNKSINDNNDNNRSSLRSSTKSIIPSNVDTNINNNTKYLVSENELQKLIEIEVNKQIVFYNEKQALLIEQLKRSFDTIEKLISEKDQQLRQFITGALAESENSVVNKLRSNLSINGAVGVTPSDLVNWNDKSIRIKNWKVISWSI